MKNSTAPVQLKQQARPLAKKRSLTVQDQFEDFFKEIDHVLMSLKDVSPLDPTGNIIFQYLYLDYFKENNPHA